LKGRTFLFPEDSRKMHEKLSTFGLQMGLNKDVVGPNLRLARERVHLPKARAALRIGISERQLTRWEKGEVLPRWENLESAADVYGIDPAELAHDEDPSEEEAPRLTDQVSALRAEIAEMHEQLAAVLELFSTADQLAAAIERRRDAAEGGSPLPAPAVSRLPRTGSGTQARQGSARSAVVKAKQSARKPGRGRA
jgi:transcriptional regulator with XRE-family HTH domain